MYASGCVSKRDQLNDHLYIIEKALIYYVSNNKSN